MISNNELSEKLCKLACQLDKASELSDSERKRIMIQIASELHAISNEKFAPSSNGIGWNDIKPQNTKKTYMTKDGRVSPF